MSIGQQSGWNVIHDRCSSAFNVFVFGFENGQTTAPKMGVEICHRTGAIGRGLPSSAFFVKAISGAPLVKAMMVRRRHMIAKAMMKD